MPLVADYHDKIGILADVRTGGTSMDIKTRYKVAGNNMLGVLHEAVADGCLDLGQYMDFVKRSTDHDSDELHEIHNDPLSIKSALYSSLNSEPRQVLITGIINDIPLTRAGLKAIYDSFLKKAPPEKKIEWEMEPANIYSYCQKILLPNGMVEKGKMMFQGTSTVFNSWRGTEFQKEFGVPVGRFMLRKSNEYNVSPHLIFGRNCFGSGKVTPLRAAKILEFLYGMGEVSVKQITDHLECSENAVINHISRMKDSGLVEGDSVGGGSWQKYRFADGKAPNDAKPVNTQTKLTSDIVDFVFGNETIKSDAVLDAIQKTGKYRNWKDDVLKTVVSSILGGLCKQGILKIDQNDYKHKENLSWNRLTEKGREYVPDVILRINDAASGGNELTSMREAAMDIFTDKYFDDVVDAIRRFSGSSSQKSKFKCV